MPFKKGDIASVFLKDAKLEVTIKSVKKNGYLISFKDYRTLKKKYGVGFIPCSNEKLVSEILLH